MSLASVWLGGLLRRRRSRIVGMTFGIALAVGMLGALGAFFAAANAHMTHQALRGSSVDWQVLVDPSVPTTNALSVVRHESGVAAAQVVGYGALKDLTCQCAGARQDAGAGRVLGIPPGYSTTFPHEIRFLIGARRGVLLAQQAASNLSATVGSVITLTLPDGRTVSLPVNGIIDLPFADSMFQTVGAPPGYGAQAPPDNVVLLPLHMWQHLTASATVTPTTSLELHVKLSRHLPPNPSAAYSIVVARAHQVEATLAGGVRVGNNVAVLLDSARKDALYAELLFLFLGLPGVVVALLLVAVLGASGRERRRKEQSLLRLRGATPSRLLRIAAMEGAVIGTLGALLGVVLALLAGKVTQTGNDAGNATGWLVTAGVVGLVSAMAIVTAPAWRDVRQVAVVDARSTLTVPSKPIWSRIFLDVVLLVLAAVIYWRSVSNNFQLVLAPEGVTTTSVDYTVFLAPLFLALGAGLLILRLAGGALRRGKRPLATLARPVAGPLTGVVVASLQRQRLLLTRGLVIIAVTMSFAVSTSLFNETFAAQSVVDARLTNGADVSVVAPGTSALPANLLQQIRQLPGVAAATALEHRFAYIGTDLQDFFGVSGSEIPRVATLSNSFFVGVTAQQALLGLASRPNAILVAEETATAYLLKPGSPLTLRLPSACDHRYHSIPFVFVGVVKEFPTAPHDSFFVANSRYVSSATCDPGRQTILVRTVGRPSLVANSIRHLLPASTGVVVTSIDAQLVQTTQGLTSLDLNGLTRLELALAFLLMAAASGLVLVLGLNERRRMFAVAVGLGAKRRDISAFVWSEIAFILVGGIIAGLVVGTVVAELLIKLLTGVFDPPPTTLYVPYAYLVGILLVTIGAGVVAGMAAIRATFRSSISILRDL